MGHNAVTCCLAERDYSCGYLNHTLVSKFCEYNVYATLLLLLLLNKS
jgi:hypothetical protein